MNVFIDTNIYFTFYNLSSESIEELKKALILHKENRITLWLPELIINEFWRNRAGEIGRLTKDFKKNVTLQIPQLVLADEKSPELIEIQKQLNKTKSEIARNLEDKILSETLDADIAVKEIFEASNRLDNTDKLVAKSITRFDLGNPPGKNGSYGDAVNWESLLENLPDDEDLYVISNDGDYYSPVDTNTINEYLSHEWQTKKASKVIAYRRLSQFIATHFPEAKTAAELERNIAIDVLAESTSFSDSHDAIKRLTGFEEYTQAQVVRIISIYHDNTQVRWIATDTDIKAFGKHLVDTYPDYIEAEALEKFRELINYA
ncbi:DUF4935 domain-containing protein [Vibrio parahaemolyticus]|uniref:PIN domain-containing protein n=1 Tax=Vibrio vulnificus TaxID=672 RepID=UPI00193E9EC1|nr:PIN domain-containing protein [Vibrio vulnificus]MBM4841813.1 DUF4935 domain-containing protein [Vibrio parahaemolyticus]EHU9474394.1 DUF4935 domain-containing protein [Vibrio vulnificus]EHZ7124078.1 DUF4935 domain-containing protein [Vibrio vulnificus]MBM4973521.1 DUF4935 domain-containing protein [Vibrio parahaemolyticus]MCA3883201.1 DUF4935 domain-containing protein [Vibrio vulnificus]